jgi:hypothetical protein
MRITTDVLRQGFATVKYRLPTAVAWPALSRITHAIVCTALARVRVSSMK